MATNAEWVKGYARQAEADLNTFEVLQKLKIPECHKLQFLRMSCEKLVKSHHCGDRIDPNSLQKSHDYVAKTLPVVLTGYLSFMRYTKPQAREMLRRARHLAQEIKVLAPAVKRSGDRPDNCEYPWEDDSGKIHVPLDWTFAPSQLLLLPGGTTFLKLVRGAIEQRLL